LTRAIHRKSILWLKEMGRRVKPGNYDGIAIRVIGLTASSVYNRFR